MASDVAPPTPGAEVGPMLGLDRQEVRLASPRGEVASAVLTLTNRGDAPLRANVVVRLGREWLRAEPATLHLAPGGSGHVEVRGDPAELESGGALGEIGIITNTGAVTIPVAMRARAGASTAWALL